MAKDTRKVIKIDKGIHGNRIPVGINGRITYITAGEDTPVEDEVFEHLSNSGVSFTEVSDGAGSAGGVRSEPAPEDTPPAMLPRTLDNSGGDQPGDVTGSLRPAPERNEPKGDNSIAAAAEVSDIRVRAERAAKADASTAEKAGEGEAGTPVVDPLDHDASGKKGGSKPRKK